jgi:hypothetical protein
MASMTDKKVKRAMEEAYRFISRAEDLLRHEEYFNSKKSGACRRASMDLTRALAAMRSSEDE